MLLGGTWFDANGNVVAWGDNAMVCCEYNTEDKFFNVMQFPKHLIDGQKVKSYRRFEIRRETGGCSDHCDGARSLKKLLLRLFLRKR